RTRLFAVAPDLDCPAVRGFRHFAADGGRRLLAASAPCAFRSEDIVEARDAHLHAMIPHVRQEEPFAEELLPAIFAIRRGGICGVLRALGIIRVELVVVRVHAGGGRVEELLHAGPPPVFQTVEVDAAGVVHDSGVVLAGEYVAGSAHIGGELIDDFDAAYSRRGDVRIAQIADDEFVGGAGGEFMSLEVHAPDPKAFGLEAFYEMSADKAPSTVNENAFGHIFERSSDMCGRAC